VRPLAVGLGPPGETLVIRELVFYSWRSLAELPPANLRPGKPSTGIMAARERIGAVMTSAGWSAVTLVWVSGTILHFFTAIVAFDLAGNGLRRYIAAIAAFVFPLAGEVAVMVAAWKASGSMINSYSIWVLLWVAFGFSIYCLIAFGNRLAGGDKAPPAETP
jgi:hypothetical protein